MNNKLIGSKYNFFLEDEDCFLVYNTLFPSLWKVEKNLFDLLKRKEVIEKSVLSDEVILKAEEAKLLVPVDEDEEKTAFHLMHKALYENELDITVIPTKGCNFRCIYCCEDHANVSMSDEDEKRLIRFFSRNIRKYKFVHIDWFGGEPLLERGRVIRIMNTVKETCNKYGVPVYANIITNGYLLDLETFESLTTSGVMYYQITIDGLAPIHDRMRPLAGGKGTYDVVINNLVNIHKYAKNNHFHISIRTNLDKDTAPEYKKFVDEMDRLFEGDKRFSFSYSTVGDWGGESVKNLNLYDTNNIDEQKEFLENVSFVENKDPFESKVLLADLCKRRCNAGKYYGFAVSPDLTLHKCTLLSYNESRNQYDRIYDINECGYISKNGNLIFDESKVSDFMCLPPVAEKCKDCCWMPYCTLVTCPIYAIDTRKTKCLKETECSEKSIRKSLWDLYYAGSFKNID